MYDIFLLILQEVSSTEINLHIVRCSDLQSTFDPSGSSNSYLYPSGTSSVLNRHTIGKHLHMESPPTDVATLNKEEKLEHISTVYLQQTKDGVIPNKPCSPTYAVMENGYTVKVTIKVGVNTNIAKNLPTGGVGRNMSSSTLQDLATLVKDANNFDLSERQSKETRGHKCENGEPLKLSHMQGAKIGKRLLCSLSPHAPSKEAEGSQTQGTKEFKSRSGKRHGLTQQEMCPQRNILCALTLLFSSLFLSRRGERCHKCRAQGKATEEKQHTAFILDCLPYLQESIP